MKKILLILGAATAMQAALPPLAQSAREIKALVSAPELYDRLGSPEAIQNILRTETGYTILTQHYLLCVDVHYPQTELRPGPVPFEFEFHTPVDLQSGQ